VAIGGAGGGGGSYNLGVGGDGGSGANVAATLTGLSTSTLYVEVGSNGTSGTGDANCSPGAGGTNGGGAGGLSRCDSGGGGGGGGASDVRTTPASDNGLTGATGDPRLVVAGGGGGGGGEYYVLGGAGGNAGDDTVSGAGNGGDCNTSSGQNGNPGGPGGVGGGGGTGGNCTSTSSVSGNSGGASGGGTGAEGDTNDDTGAGGGGGGGYIGGGGGGVGNGFDGSGGGGGSSFGPAGTVFSTSSASPSVTISWTPPAPVIAGVYFEGESSSPTIVISGSGFGDEADLGTPNYLGLFGGGDGGSDYPNFTISDNTAGINVGGAGDFVGIIISSYTNTQIVLTLGADYQVSVGQINTYSSYGFVAGDAYALNLLGSTSSGDVAYYPTVTITLPTGGGAYALGAPVPTAFSCSDFPGGEGISSCVDSNGSGSGSGLLKTSAAGSFTYTVTATSDEGFTGTASMPYTVNQASPSITSTPNVTTVNLGSSTPPVLKDTATLSGGGGATGSITFTLVDTSTATTVDTETVTNVNGNGSYTTPTGYTLPTSLLPPVPGLYQWNVTYSGDDNNAGVSDNNDPAEQVNVNDASPTLTSTPTPTSVTLSGSAVNLKDTMIISSSYDAQGTLTFTLVYSNNVVDTETVTVNGNGSYSTPAGYTLPATGTVTGIYQWNAQYSGDTNNTSNDDNNSANEQVVVKGRPDATTTSMNIAKGNVIYGAEAVQTINGVVTGVKGDGAPEGSVNVTYGASATSLCSATLVPGTGDSSTYKCALTSNTQLGATNYLTVRATFVPAMVSSTSPNFAYTTSKSGAFSGDNFLVKKDSTTTKVTVSPNSVTSGSESSAIFSVSVKSGNTVPVPTGETVTVKVGSTSCQVSLSAGLGTCWIGNSALGVGSYWVTATYAGDTNLSGSSGSASFTVKRH
jgi:hypothetical protein